MLFQRIAVALFCLIICANPVTPHADLRYPIAANINAVVSVKSKDFMGLSAGSGVVLDTNGLVLTCYHVVEGSRDVTVEDYQSFGYPAKVIKFDKDMDLALLRIDGTFDYKSTLSKDTDIYPGQPVFAIGNPKTLDRNVSVGVVSSIENMEEGSIIHDAAISAGSSGCPLYNDRGEIIGIVYAYREGQNLNFAVPAEAIRKFLEQ